jgi:hypothetical protein
LTLEIIAAESVKLIELAQAGKTTEMMSDPSSLRCCLLRVSTIAAVPVGLVFAFAASAPQPAHALLTYNIFETAGGDVVVETNGSS